MTPFSAVDQTETGCGTYRPEHRETGQLGAVASACNLPGPIQRSALSRTNQGDVS